MLLLYININWIEYGVLIFDSISSCSCCTFELSKCKKHRKRI